MPGVDIVADVSESLPFPDDHFDGVYGGYIIEHISWRKVRKFISECYRTLKPGGTCVMVTANLYQQAIQLIKSDHWEDSLVGMIFGDNNYPENIHRCGFSPEFARRLFSEADFHRTNVYMHPHCETDMIIIGVKSKCEISEIVI